MPKANTECEVAPESHGILGVPRSKPAAESQWCRIGDHLEITGRSLQEGRQARKIRDSRSARCGVFVVLEFLKPCAEIELMDSTADLQTVGECVEVPLIARPRCIIRARRRNRRGCSGGCRPADDDSAGGLSGYKGKT